MKTNKFLKVLLSLMVVFAVVSCVQDDDYKVPTSLGDEENAKLTKLLANSVEVTIAEAKTYLVPNQVTPIVADVYVKGYVSSSDQTGNFHKQFYIQDHPTNPTAAIKIMLNQVDSYNQFNFGREVYVNLKGLLIGEARTGDGMTAIGGDANGDRLVALKANQIPAKVLRSSVTEVMEPLSVTFSQIDNSYVGMFVKIDNAQFSNALAGKFFVDPVEDFDTSRPIESCDGFGYSYFPLQTSSFATFAQQPLPTTKGGSISGVVSKTFNGSNLILVLNGVDGIDFNQAKCTPANLGDFSVVMEEDFNTATDNTDLNFVGWTNFSEAGTRVWREKFWLGNGYTEFAPFGSGQASNIGWLVTPSIDLTGLDNVFLNFKSAQHHLDQNSAQNALKVYVSTDFTGSNVLTATWIEVSATLVTSSNPWREFVDSGLVDLSAYSGGTLHVAFVANGSDTLPNLSGSYMIDDVKVLAN